MDLLVGALIVLVLIDLLLTFGVIRRLREHTTKIAGLQAGQLGMTQSLQPGSTIPDFHAMSAENGVGFSADDLRKTTSIVAFHAVGCHVCERDIPILKERLGAARDQGLQAFVIVSTLPNRVDDPSHDHVAELTESLSGLATVIGEPLSGPAQTAFEVGSYPTYFVVDPGGVVAAVAGEASDLPTDTSAAGIPTRTG